MSPDENTSDIIDIDPENIVEAKPDDAPKASVKPARFGGRIAVVAGVALISALGGGWLYRDVLSNYLPSNQIQALTTRLNATDANGKAMATKLDAVVGVTDEIKSNLGAAQTAAEDARQKATSTVADTSTLKAQFAKLDKSLVDANQALADLKTKLQSGGGQIAAAGDATALAARLDKVEKDLAALKQSSTGAKPDVSVLSQSLADLKAKVATGVAYADEFDRIARLVPAAEGLDVLKGAAPTGIVNAKDLASAFQALSATLPKPELAAPKDDSWSGKISGMFSGLVTINAVGVVDWPQVAQAAAEAAAKGDLTGAIAVLEKAGSDLPPDLKKLQDKAKTRLAVEQALEKTSSAVLREIAARG